MAGERINATCVELQEHRCFLVENGVVANETRLALRTQGRSPVGAAAKRGEDPPAGIIYTPSRRFGQALFLGRVTWGETTGGSRSPRPTMQFRVSTEII